MSNNNDESGKEAIGCFILIVIVVFAPVLIMLFKLLIALSVVAVVGYAMYHIQKYDQNTGVITKAITKVFNLDQVNHNPEEAEDVLVNEIRRLGEEIKNLPANTQPDPVVSINMEDVEDIVAQKLNERDKQHKKDLLSSIFSDSIEGGYNEADMFEKREHFEKIKKKEEELTIRELKQEVAEELLDHKTIILEHKYETRNEFVSIRQEMSEGFMKVKENLLMLAQDMMTFKTYVVEKFSTLELAFMNEMNNMKMMLKDVHTELKQEISQTKLQFGQEILRIDRQQLTIIDKMRDYEAKVRAFGLEVMKVKMDAERFAMRGQEMLSKAQILQERHKVEVMQLSKDINLSLEKMAVREEGFANKVGSAKLQMEHISNQQYLALKDMAFERIGINALREDYQKRVTLEETKIARLNDQQRNILQQIQTEQAHGREISGLQHQLSMTKEDARHSQHQLSMYQQEAAQVRRLSN